MIEYDIIVVIGALYEGILILPLTLAFILLTARKYFQFRNKQTLYLFLVFLFILFAVISSWFSKFITLFTELDYIYNAPQATYSQTPLNWIFLRIVDFRISLAMVSIAAFFNYCFKVKLYNESYRNIQTFLFTAYTLFTIIFAFFIYIRGNTFLDALCFLFIFIEVFFVYLPFMVRTWKGYKMSDDSFLRKKFLSLCLMAFNFLMVLLSFLIDRLLVMIGFRHFTFFYFLAWIFQVAGIIFAYIGFILPRSEQKKK
jgi:hypothetical protein